MGLVDAQLKTVGHKGLWPDGRPQIHNLMDGKDEEGVTIADPYQFRPVIHDVARADKYINSKQGLLYEHDLLVDCFPRNDIPRITIWDETDHISPWLIDPYYKPINPDYATYGTGGMVRY